MYEYKCTIVRIIDGDTVVVDIDLGFNVSLSNQHVRLAGIDAPETRTRDLEEKVAGFESKAYVEKILPIGSTQILISKEYSGKYGRIIGDFKVYDMVYDAERLLTEIMLRDGVASIYE